MEAGLVVSGRDFGDAHPLQETDEGGAGEQSRIRVEYQVEPKGNEGQGELAGCLGATVTVTRERRYRAAFDDGLLYKGGFRGGGLWWFGLILFIGMFMFMSVYVCVCVCIY